MSEPVIQCPNCGKEFPLDAAFREHFAEEKRQAVADAVKNARQSAVEETENRLRQRMAQQGEELEKAREDLTDERESRQAELEGVRQAVEKETTERFQQQMAQQGDELKQTREVLASERQVRDEAVKSAREQAAAEADERHRLAMRAKDVEMERLGQELETLRRRTSQGAVELQGEALEDWLRDELQAAFPLDGIEDVSKGQTGADLVQRVFNRMGKRSGIIVWEAKNTKNWNAGWLAKARQDAERLGSALPAIVSVALPDGVRTAKCIEGVWVCSMDCALVVGHLLRQQLLETSDLQRAMQGHEGKMANVYAYVVSDGFRSHMERIIDSWIELSQQIESEERAMKAQWKVRRKQLERVLNITTDMHAEIKAIVGAELPQVEGLTLNALPAGEEETEAL